MQAMHTTDEWFEVYDIIFRAIDNPKISHVYFRLYISMLDSYPQLLTGELITDFDLESVRKKAGCASVASATKFIGDLKAIDAILLYEPGGKIEQGNVCLGRIRGNPDKIPYPEYFKLSETAQRKKELDAQRARDAARALILNCAKCGSAKIKYDLVAICKECGFKHLPIKDVDKELIHIGNTPPPDTFGNDGFFPDLEAESDTAAITIPADMRARMEANARKLEDANRALSMEEAQSKLIAFREYRRDL